MEIISEKINKALKFSISFTLKTPLLLRSGFGGEFTDSSIERTYDGKLHINGYVWSSLLRRCLKRIEGGEEIAERIGKYKKDSDGNQEIHVSPLWVEPSIVDNMTYDVRTGNAIERKFGTGKTGALYNDEVVPPGIRFTLNGCFFFNSDEDKEKMQGMLVSAMYPLNEGIENIGGGWSYGLGRIECTKISIKYIDLTLPEDRKNLWVFDKIKWDSTITEAEIKETPTVAKHWKKIKVKAKITEGQLFAIHSSYPAFDPSMVYQEYPDSFVFKGYVIDADSKSIRNETIIPGRSIRQALLSVPIERKLRTIKPENICDSLAYFCQCDKCNQYRESGNKNSDSDDCICLKCKWFGSGAKGGIVSVSDAIVNNPDTEILHRIQLCEHSMQNVNLFSGEYLKAGSFDFDILVDYSREGKNNDELMNELEWLLNEMKENPDVPPGWYRMGATSACTGQITVLDWKII